MTTGLDGSSYTYDAQNRLLSATKNGVTMVFKYDGLNRQVTRASAGSTTYNVYDGWDLIEECAANGTIQASYAYGVTGPLFGNATGRTPLWVYYYQNGEGSTSQIPLVLCGSLTGTICKAHRYQLLPSV